MRNSLSTIENTCYVRTTILILGSFIRFLQSNRTMNFHVNLPEAVAINFGRTENCAEPQNTSHSIAFAFSNFGARICVTSLPFATSTFTMISTATITCFWSLITNSIRSWTEDSRFNVLQRLKLLWYFSFAFKMWKLFTFPQHYLVIRIPDRHS